MLFRELNRLQPSETCFQCMHNWYLLAIFHIAIAKGDNIVPGKLVKIYYFHAGSDFHGRTWCSPVLALISQPVTSPVACRAISE